MPAQNNKNTSAPGEQPPAGQTESRRNQNASNPTATNHSRHASNPTKTNRGQNTSNPTGSLSGLSYYELILSLLAGILSVFAFAPFHVWPLIILSLSYLIGLCCHRKPISSFYLGLSFGIGFFGFGCYWLFISIYHFGGAPWATAFGLISLAVGLLALFLAIYTYLLQKFWPGTSAFKLFLSFPASWMLMEALRSSLFTGFPWLLIGFTSTVSPLRGLAPLIGVYGLSFILCSCSGAIIYLTCKKPLTSKIVAAIALALLLVISQLLTHIAWTARGKPLNVSLIQANIPQTIKWSPDRIQPILTKYAELTAQIKNSQIIIWPESAIPTFLYRVPQFTQELQDYAVKNKLSLFVGGLTWQQTTDQYFNSLVLYGNTTGRYSKQHLVPFGEYFPLPSLSHKLLAMLNIPMASFTPGAKKQPTLIAQNIPIAAFICYEIAFPRLVLSSTEQRQLIVTVSDDSWFGESIALAQHLQMAVLQSQVTGRDQLFTSNSGITAIIDRSGTILAQAPINQTHIVNGQVAPALGSTPIMKLGYLPLFLIAGLLLVIGLLTHKKIIR